LYDEICPNGGEAKFVGYVACCRGCAGDPRRSCLRAALRRGKLSFHGEGWGFRDAVPWREDGREFFRANFRKYAVLQRQRVAGGNTEFGKIEATFWRRAKLENGNFRSGQRQSSLKLSSGCDRSASGAHGKHKTRSNSFQHDCNPHLSISSFK
jgi:hypothetical protein